MEGNVKLKGELTSTFGTASRNSWREVVCFISMPKQVEGRDDDEEEGQEELKDEEDNEEEMDAPEKSEDEGSVLTRIDESEMSDLSSQTLMDEPMKVVESAADVCPMPAVLVCM